MKRWPYRLRQFRLALTARPDPLQLDETRRLLTPAQYTLFTRLQPSEQAHAIAVLQKVREDDSHPDLLTAALLHDIGKIVHPLKLWERIYIVLTPKTRGAAGPRATQKGSRPLRGPLRVAAEHPAWGADLARRAGASPLAVNLIRRHQTHPNGKPMNLEDRLLALLQAADDAS